MRGTIHKGEGPFYIASKTIEIGKSYRPIYLVNDKK